MGSKTVIRIPNVWISRVAKMSTMIPACVELLSVAEKINISDSLITLRYIRQSHRYGKYVSDSVTYVSDNVTAPMSVKALRYISQ